MPSRIELVSDNDFKEIIDSSKNWKEITKKLGYSRGSSLKIRPKIISRCKELNIFPKIDYTSSILTMTKGELFNSRKNWQSARTAIRKLADAAFKNSNKPKECVICGYNKHIEIAHIKGVSEFSNDDLISQINDIDNLIALCPNHHWEFDSGQLSEEDKKKIYK